MSQYNQNNLNKDGINRIHVLYVDDDQSLLEVSKEILETDYNFYVDITWSVDAALEKIKTNHYDIVVSDYEMPCRNGLEFLFTLKELGSVLPFILFTGKGREEVAMKALNLGADGYYNKQGSPETVYGELANGIRLAAERAKAKLRLEESEKRYRTLMEQAAESILVHNVTGQIVDANQQACINLGYTKKELLSLNIADIYPAEKENKHERLFWPRGHEEQSVIFSSTQKRKDGTVFWVEATLGRIILDQETLILELSRDITERKRTEEKLKESHARMEAMNEKLRVIGGLTRHDVRNKLFVMTSNTYLLKKNHPDQADIVEGARKIRQAIRHIDELLDFSKAYEQLGAEELNYVDVEIAINEALGPLKDMLEAKIVNDCKGLSLLADSLLKQIFYNLFDNSIKHGGKVTEVKFYFEMVGQKNLRLICEDDGDGVPDTNKSKIFNIGFSTSGSSGFGLYLTRRLIESYGWMIEENGVRGKGAKFIISIPKLNQSGKENFHFE